MLSSLEGYNSSNAAYLFFQLLCVCIIINAVKENTKLKAIQFYKTCWRGKKADICQAYLMV